jgi:hypothetical protein
MNQEKDIQIISTLLLLIGIETYKTKSFVKKILHKIYVFAISLIFVYDLQHYIRLIVLAHFTHLIPFMTFLNLATTIIGIWVLLMQNLVFPRILDSVFREFSAIDRILLFNFGLKINYARIRKKFHIICGGVLLSFVLYVTIVIWIVLDGKPYSLVLFSAQFINWLIILLYGYICYNIIFRIRIIRRVIIRNMNYHVQHLQQIFQHLSNIVKISNRYFGLKFLVMIGNL